MRYSPLIDWQKLKKSDLRLETHTAGRGINWRYYLRNKPSKSKMHIPHDSTILLSDSITTISSNVYKIIYTNVLSIYNNKSYIPVIRHRAVKMNELKLYASTQMNLKNCNAESKELQSTYQMRPPHTQTCNIYHSSCLWKHRKETRVRRHRR